MQLKPGTKLQGGKYEIVRTLGQGGFGITYKAEQVLLHREVAVKEFFMKDCCERDLSTSHVSVGTGSQRELVRKFREKFLREAQMIAALDNPHIVKIHDVFEENGTAYYVMENLPGGSLTDKVKKEGPLSEAQAEKYIRQVADALSYLHERDTVHLDVKPSNILLNAKGEAVLIDFGISKHYDKAGEQTSSTPVGISKGYAPLEQGRDGDVSQFGPSTDIYALGATLYHLVSGQVPPEASVVVEEGLDRPQGVSDRLWNVIVKSMQPKRKDRPQSIEAFLVLLDSKSASAREADDEEATLVVKPHKLELKPEPTTSPSVKSDDGVKPKIWLWALIVGLLALGVILALILGSGGKGGTDAGMHELPTETVSGTPEAEAIPEAPAEGKPVPVANGSAKITTTPSGATIWLDGKNTKKTTPEVFEDLTPGKHSVKLVLNGYKDYNGSVTITSGKRANLSQSLETKEPISAPTHTPTTNTAPTQPQPQASSGTNRVSTQDNSANAERVTDKPSTGMENGHQWVDLGLSVKWATCNVGASSQSDYGDYFTWGETVTLALYSWSEYELCDGSYNSLTRYNTKSEYGTVDNKKRIDLSDDAARASWGGKWRMPTKAEFDELKSNCTYTWVKQGGGYKVTSKKNGNSIFLPAAGAKSESSARYTKQNGFYWSSSLYVGEPCDAWCLRFDVSGAFGSGRFSRYYGLTIRPVIE